jgi:hypothetical protein
MMTHVHTPKASISRIAYLVTGQERAEEISDFVDFAIFLLVPSAMRLHDSATLHGLFLDGCSTLLILLRMPLQLPSLR